MRPITRERGAANVGGISEASKMPSLSLKVLVPAFWQSFCYWLMGAESNSPAVTAILVGAYKIFQSTVRCHGVARECPGKASNDPARYGLGPLDGLLVYRHPNCAGGHDCTDGRDLPNSEKPQAEVKN